ncbi:ATP-binding protein [Actinomadura sp. HBU206391]|uniref:ATP-binding protein n=1 Tax=Actinomadura sp. HBU206391 TaxID=2731692 RepID=UPI001650B6BF|nr:ATP-binding protein [Actinomadura sp. HBU206391]
MSEEPCRDRLCGIRGVLLKEVRLRNRPEAVAAGRREVVASAAAWGLPGEIAQDAETCVSELVTNAVKHATGLPDSTLRLLVIRSGDRLRVEVHDAGRELPRPRRPDPCDESGRGLFIVGFLAAGHGTYLTATGKAVWFELAAWPKPGHADR